MGGINAEYMGHSMKATQKITTKTFSLIMMASSPMMYFRRMMDLMGRLLLLRGENRKRRPRLVIMEPVLLEGRIELRKIKIMTIYHLTIRKKLRKKKNRGIEEKVDDHHKLCRFIRI